MISMMMIGLGLLLVAATFFNRPTPVVVVEQRHDGGCLMTVFAIGILVGIYLLYEPSKEAGLTAPAEQQEELPADKVSPPEVVDLEFYENVAPRRDFPPDTLINSKPRGKSAPKEVSDPLPPVRLVILVKRFDNENDAALLQKHFSKWDMQVLTTDDPDYPYWNCVFINSENEGSTRLREWYRHHEDFDRFDLELKILPIAMM